MKGFRVRRRNRILSYKKQKYRNFILKLDWKVLHKYGNSGVFICFPDPDNGPLIAIDNGYEIQTDYLAQAIGNSVNQIGAIYGIAAQVKIFSKSVRECNIMEIQVIEQKYTVIISNEKIIV